MCGFQNDTSMLQLMLQLMLQRVCGFQNDTDKNGYLELSELKVALRTLPSCEALSEADLDAFAEFCDILGNGR